MYRIIRTIVVCSVLFCGIGSLYAQSQLEIVRAYYLMQHTHRDSSSDFGKVVTFNELREVLTDTRLDELMPMAILRCVGPDNLDSAAVRCRITNDIDGHIRTSTKRWITLSDLTLDTNGWYISLCDSVGNNVPLTPRTYAMAPGEYVKVSLGWNGFVGGVISEFARMRALFHTECLLGTPVEVCDKTQQDSVLHFFNRMSREGSFHWPNFYSIHKPRSSPSVIPDAFLFSAFGPTIVPLEAYPPEVRRHPTVDVAWGPISDTIVDPVILLDTKDEWNVRYSGVAVGDTLTTVPMSLYRAKHASIAVCARRASRSDATHRRWSEDSLFGPEPTTSGSPGDSIIFEVLRPSEDGINGIINPSQDRWIDQPLLRQALRMDDVAMPNRSDVYSFAVPDSILRSPNYGASNFRLRITLRARNQGTMDDNDAWLIDEIHAYVDSVRDVSLQDVDIPLSYSVLGHRQAAAAPIEVFVVNRTQNVHRNVRVRVQAQSLSMPSRILTVERIIDSLSALQQLSITLPTMNLNAVANPAYFNTLTADTVLLTAAITSDDNVVHVDSAYRDYFPFNDTIMRRVPIRIGRALGYDAYEDEGHHAVAEEALYGSGFGLQTNAYPSNFDGPIARYGGSPITYRPEPGAIVMRFSCAWSDTLFGYQFAFDRTVVANNPCTAELIRLDSTGVEVVVGNSRITFHPGQADALALDTMGTYSLPKPVPLEIGTYYLRLTQTTDEPLNLCATVARAGVFVQKAEAIPELGRAVSACLDFRDIGFPFFSQKPDSAMHPFVGEAGKVLYSYSNFDGAVNGTPTFRRGTWMPVMRVVLGHIPTDLSTSVDAADAAPSITIAPNPARDFIRVTLNEPNAKGSGSELNGQRVANALTVELIALTGEVVCKGQGQGALTLDVSGVAAGAYLLRVICAEITTSRMIVLQ